MSVPYSNQQFTAKVFFDQEIEKNTRSIINDITQFVFNRLMDFRHTLFKIHDLLLDKVLIMPDNFTNKSLYFKFTRGKMLSIVRTYNI